MKKIHLNGNPVLSYDNVIESINYDDSDNTRFILYCSKKNILHAINIHNAIEKDFEGRIAVFPELIYKDKEGDHYWELSNRDVKIFSLGDGSA